MCVKKEKGSNPTLGDMEETKQVDISLELLERRKAQDNMGLGSQQKAKPMSSLIEKHERL